MGKPSDIEGKNWVEVPNTPLSIDPPQHTRPDLISQPTTSTAKERVETEAEELMEKIDKLNEFMLTEQFESLPGDQRFLLQWQSDIMDTYAIILLRRLAIWTD